MASTETRENPAHDEISERAHAIWEERGRPDGRELEHWLDAERQLRQERESRQGGRQQKGGRRQDVDEAERRLDGLVESKPSPARRTPSGEQL
jgi:hypothetical protein